MDAIYNICYNIWETAFAFHDLNAYRSTIKSENLNFSNKEISLGLKVTA